MTDQISTGISIVVLCLLGLWLLVLVPHKMARTRGRNPVTWALISLLVLPLIAIPVLWLLGDKSDAPADMPSDEDR